MCVRIAQGRFSPVGKIRDVPCSYLIMVHVVQRSRRRSVEPEMRVRLPPCTLAGIGTKKAHLRDSMREINISHSENGNHFSVPGSPKGKSIVKKSKSITKRQQHCGGYFPPYFFLTYHQWYMKIRSISK